MYGYSLDRKLNSTSNMPKVPIRKAKRVSVLTKRSQCLGKHYKERSYRPLYEKLKNNNTYLAKALSKEKQNSQSLFTQNLELIGEIQQLNLVGNTRNTVISNVLSNAKEILKMLVSITGYMTNTISMCQELVVSNATVRLSSVSGRKETSNRLSTKSPAKGVVKPMVGGHTITKPTINLSRVNMETINNISRLSDIQEVTTPNRNQEINENRSPIPTTSLRYENGRTCTLPERLTITSPRVNVTDEQRLIRRRRSHHSKRLSVSFSRSRNSWSEIDNSPTTPTGHIDVIGTRIDIESQESNDDTSRDLLHRVNATSEPQVSNSNEEDETRVDESMLKKDSDVQISNRVSFDKNISRNSSVRENSRLLQNNTRTWEEEDPLEGPSWLFNNIMPSRDNESNLTLSDVNNNTSQVVVYDDSSITESNTEEISNLNESMSDIQTSERDAAPNVDRSESESYLQDEQDVDDSTCEILPTASVSKCERSLDNTEDSNTDDKMKIPDFVTMRRGHSEALEDETEDFTLMLHRNRQQFNMNELRLPVLEESTINNTAVNNETDSGVIDEIPIVTNVPVASVTTRSLNESDYDIRLPNVSVKLPLVSIDDHKKMLQKTRNSNKNSKKSKMSNTKDQTSNTENSSTVKNVMKSKSKGENSRDPSTAKVVLEKLNESHVKSRVSANDSQNTNNVTKDVASDEEENLRNAESGTYASSRPRRRKAPVNLKEPNLHKKLRRD